MLNYGQSATLRHLLLVVLWLCYCCDRAVAKSEGQSVVERPQPGEVVTEAQIEQFGTDKLFSREVISPALFERIRGKSFKADCPLSLDELCYLSLLHYDLKGEIRCGELICNVAIADDLIYIFRSLYEAHFPIECVLLVDDFNADDQRSMEANNSSSFNFRYISGSIKISKHGMGMAVDINPLYNPYVKLRNGSLHVEPKGAEAYVDRSKEFPCKIDSEDLCCRLFKERGFIWGGDWKSLKDYQHFEK